MIHLHHVGVSYPTRDDSVEALREISLDIGSEFLGIVGPSGCGKSTLLRVMSGLLAPTSGRIDYDTRTAFSYGIVFQDYSLLPWLTVRQNIELALELRGESAPGRRAVSQRLLALLGLCEAEDLLPHQLSGGMRQRVAVGRAFAPDPTLLLMDEPFGSLDIVTRKELQEVLLHVYEAEPHTIVFVTHDVEEALFLCDRICVLNARPGTIRQVINVPLARPRLRQMTRTPAFSELKYEIEDSLRAADASSAGGRS